MAFRQALQLAACGLAGGSAAVLFSAVAVGKPRAGGDAEPRPAEPPAWAGGARPSPGVWDPNWDRREPLSLINLRKRNVESGEEELASKLDHYKAKATRHIFLIRHSQYHVDGSQEKDRTLTPLGREQAELTGLRLASLGLKFNKIVHSSMTRAVETTDIISRHLPGELQRGACACSGLLVAGWSRQLLRQGLGMMMAAFRAPMLLPRRLQSQHRPATGRRPHRAGPTCVSLEARSCGKNLPSSPGFAALLGSASTGPAVPCFPGSDGLRPSDPCLTLYSTLTVLHSAPSSITKMEPGSRPPSGTISTGQTPGRRRTVMRSSSVTPTSSATLCAGGQLPAGLGVASSDFRPLGKPEEGWKS
uniref:Serine/threonine-protein phosphatase PGAM5, mitochondrial n=1 Tax=Callithrix jacchus TaxID=9483 RepID=A0A8I3WLU0_CALJA